MSLLTERMISDLDMSAEQAIDRLLANIPSDTELTDYETSDSDSSTASASCVGNVFSTILPLAPITMHPTSINRVILNYKPSLDKFVLFLSINYESRNLVEFWLGCDSLSKINKEDYRKTVKKMYQQFLRGNAMQRVAISKKSLDLVKAGLNHNGSLRAAMDLAQSDAFNILQLEAFPQFKSTLHFQNLLKDPFFISLCHAPPPPPASVCSSCFSTQSSISTKLSTDSSISPESEKSNNYSYEASRDDSMRKKIDSRSKHNGNTNVEQFATLIINHLEKELQARMQLTREVQESLRHEGNLEDYIDSSDWTSHPTRMKYIKLSIEPEDSNTNIYDVIASTSEDILSHPNESELQPVIKTDTLFNPIQFMPLPSQLELKTKPIKSSSSDILPLGYGQYENIQINRYFQGIESREKQTSRVKLAHDTALQLLQNAHDNMDVDTKTNWIERHNSQRKRRHSYHRSESQNSLLTDMSSCDSVASLPLKNSPYACYFPKRQNSDIMDNTPQIHHYATLPRKHHVHRQQQQQQPQPQPPQQLQPQQQQQHYPELQVFYRVGENSDINLFTRVEHTTRAPFLLRDFIQKVLKRQGNYRYYFKSFSVDLNESVWEEVFHEEQPVPLHRGKIMALVVPHPSS